MRNSESPLLYSAIRKPSSERTPNQIGRFPAVIVHDNEFPAAAPVAAAMPAYPIVFPTQFAVFICVRTTTSSFSALRQTRHSASRQIGQKGEHNQPNQWQKVSDEPTQQPPPAAHGSPGVKGSKECTANQNKQLNEGQAERGMMQAGSTPSVRHSGLIRHSNFEFFPLIVPPPAASNSPTLPSAATQIDRGISCRRFRLARSDTTPSAIAAPALR